MTLSRSTTCMLLAVSAIVHAPFTVMAQERPGAPRSQDVRPADVVVEGYRERKTPETRTRTPAAISVVQSRRKAEYSERIARCAARSKLSSLAMLRAVVDGEVNSAPFRAAQDRLVRSNVTCSESGVLLSLTGPPRSAEQLANALSEEKARTTTAVNGGFTGISGLTEASPLGWSVLDRGAFTVAALRRFVPGLKLTDAETGNPAVQSRFNLREVPRNRFREAVDHEYFQTAVCMVRVEPELSVRLAMSDGNARLGDVQEALIDRTRICVGNATHVEVDPTHFRLYIADAVYRWAVAARGVASLIPDDIVASTSATPGR